MKLRTYLVVSSLTGIGVLLICLFVSYSKMLLTIEQFYWLSAISAGIGLFSFVLQYVLTKPLEKSIARITERTKRLAEGDFRTEVPLVGPQEFKLLAQQFNEMSSRLNESFDDLHHSESARRELIANVSHDLRTPLASIQAFVEALEDDVIKDEVTFQRYLNTIRLETKRLGGLIQDLFDLSSLEAKGEKFDPQPGHVDELLLSTLESFSFHLAEKQLNVEIDLPERLPAALMVPAQMKRVLSNLLQNAIQYSPVEGKIILTATQQEECIRIAVIDEGEGIDAEETACIFERFYRIDKSRSKNNGGAGIGLAIAKSIVEGHGGEIGVQSTKGAGSCFWFTLPVYVSRSNL
ncbi:sensor histidine kinase [Paenibacillus silvae]|uniref:sensor histidine kinase n=1 Tax=Paenibacillus silvae TaxID=1325358 RepID=UPI002005A5E8|nr:HAMP domain-containing sensor histidine kinase [Paenibacillus silvae]MCK6073824.1 HAMP domain-containing protein [Paenibacillus silvae]MCK6148700.1 HAMP domain-containing protein [Paenibacillus silvae]MCK6267000.1 HAMP domain-containing protein [Paenibacillus silvae]